MEQRLVQLLDRTFLSTRAGLISTVQSCPVPMVGNAITMTVKVHNAAAVGNCTFDLQVVRGAEAWRPIANVAQAAFGVNEVAAAAVQAAQLRVEAVLTGTNSDIEISVWALLSEQ